MFVSFQPYATCPTHKAWSSLSKQILKKYIVSGLALETLRNLYNERIQKLFVTVYCYQHDMK